MGTIFCTCIALFFMFKLDIITPATLDGVTLSKESASEFLSKSVAKHTNQERCSTDESYCESNRNYCSSEEVNEYRCKQRCTVFQTCVIRTHDCHSWNIYGYKAECEGIEAFHQGAGTFTFLILFTVVIIAFIVISVILCVRKYRKKKRQNEEQALEEEPDSPAMNRNQRRRPEEVHGNRVMPLPSISTAESPPAYPGSANQFKKRVKDRKKSSQKGKKRLDDKQFELQPIQHVPGHQYVMCVPVGSSMNMANYPGSQQNPGIAPALMTYPQQTPAPIQPNPKSEVKTTKIGQYNVTLERMPPTGPVVKQAFVSDEESDDKPCIDEEKNKMEEHSTCSYSD